MILHVGEALESFQDKLLLFILLFAISRTAQILSLNRHFKVKFDIILKEICSLWLTRMWNPQTIKYIKFNLKFTEFILCCNTFANFTSHALQKTQISSASFEIRIRYTSALSRISLLLAPMTRRCSIRGILLLF